ncbi:MAG: hypothetical protein CME70_03320 [Halobacteriovorax sp.]|nr:hypothetical protein [Halobacteriovorax sp.]MBK23014.1 hypothetical protein [Halobacteriovorax sp.]|tara:strand:- start:57809 stop:58816 length:1008 start_codon:yes stop_codon:yes gene_type:complete
MKKLLTIICIAVTLFSCNKDEEETTRDVVYHGGSLPDDYYEAPQNDCTDEEEEQTEESDGKFRPSIAVEDSIVWKVRRNGTARPNGWKNFKYKQEWVDKTMELAKLKTHYPRMLTQKINQSDLNLIGCPNFNDKDFGDENKRKFWSIYFASKSGREGGHNPKAYYDETGVGDSYGLLQVDSKQCNANTNALKNPNLKGNFLPNRRGSKYSDGGDMFIPEKNLTCGFNVLENQLRRWKNSLFTGECEACSYWATNRFGRKSHKKFVKSLRFNFKQIPACKGRKTIEPIGQDSLLAKMRNKKRKCTSNTKLARNEFGKSIELNRFNNSNNNTSSITK